MARPQPCPHCRRMVLAALSDRLATTLCEIGILDVPAAVSAVRAGAAVFHLRNGTFRRGASTAHPMLAEHRCPANAEESRARPCYEAPF